MGSSQFANNLDYDRKSGAPKMPKHTSAGYESWGSVLHNPSCGAGAGDNLGTFSANLASNQLLVDERRQL
ncbi:MAG: hypothetical protein EAZ34_03160 [Polaromonas sp.]|nr:MAG: hypothetical protein EAZ34_03160 [Polaromonas sp.]